MNTHIEIMYKINTLTCAYTSYVPYRFNCSYIYIICTHTCAHTQTGHYHQNITGNTTRKINKTKTNKTKATATENKILTRDPDQYLWYMKCV